MRRRSNSSLPEITMLLNMRNMKNQDNKPIHDARKVLGARLPAGRAGG